jgi:hypothetical protein
LFATIRFSGWGWGSFWWQFKLSLSVAHRKSKIGRLVPHRKAFLQLERSSSSGLLATWKT